MFIYLGVAAVIFVSLSFVPGLLKRRMAGRETEVEEDSERKDQ